MKKWMVYPMFFMWEAEQGAGGRGVNLGMDPRHPEWTLCSLQRIAYSCHPASHTSMSDFSWNAFYERSTSYNSTSYRLNYLRSFHFKKDFISCYLQFMHVNYLLEQQVAVFRIYYVLKCMDQHIDNRWNV